MNRWERQRLSWQRTASNYDRRIAPVEGRFLGPTRPWVCGRATGEVLEVACGTGLNLPHYQPEVRLTASDLSVQMLLQARRRAAELGRTVDFVEAPAESLPFEDASFDSLVCTYALCGVPDVRATLAEFCRVLRPGGNVLLADHVISSSWWVRGLQRLIDAYTGRNTGEYWTRRPRLELAGLGVEVVDERREHFGVVECVHGRTQAANAT